MQYFVILNMLSNFTIDQHRKYEIYWNVGCYIMHFQQIENPYL